MPGQQHLHACLAHRLYYLGSAWIWCWHCCGVRCVNLASSDDWTTATLLKGAPDAAPGDELTRGHLFCFLQSGVDPSAGAHLPTCFIDDWKAACLYSGALFVVWYSPMLGRGQLHARLHACILEFLSGLAHFLLPNSGILDFGI